MKTSDYDYDLPDELIARYPASPKSSAKLLVYNRSNESVIHSSIGNIQEFLPKDTALIFNDTKVMKARIFGQKHSGAKCEILYLASSQDNHHSVMIRGKVKVGSEIIFHDGTILRVIKLLDDGLRIVIFLKDEKVLSFEDIAKFLDTFGETPLPPYMSRSANWQDETDYQTCFAKHIGSVAAPTASLHFDDAAFLQLKARPHAFVTLHVGAGTFKPVECDNVLEHKMHSESFFVSQKAQDIINSNTNITAFGTTACRAVESFVRGKQDSTNLFLHPNNPPQRVDHLLTNFHLPKSTLIMLVASFIGKDKTLALYSEAIAKRYRFYSYGDAMLIV